MKIQALVAVMLMVGACAGGADEGLAGARGGTDCSMVKCALPLCAQGQHLVNQGGCCPVCVGADDKCATVLCAAVECAEGEQRVYSKGDCCGRCQKTAPVKQCITDEDCPQIACITCPCPYNECHGGECLSQTPDESTCAQP